MLSVAIELSPEQRRIAILEEAEYQLVVMKQYLVDDDKALFIVVILFVFT